MSKNVITYDNAQTSKIKSIFKILQQQNSHPTTELIYSSAFELLVSVVLSAQATDISVNKVTRLLFNVANTPQKMCALGVVGVESYIKSIGLYHTKAQNVVALSKVLIEKHDGLIPDTFEQLVDLPGVGRKTANVVLNTLYAKPTIAVDTHVFRVSNRLGIAKGSTPLMVELKLNQIVPNEYKVHAHHWLILHGRYVCKARVPDCINCSIKHYCEFYGRNT